MYWGGTRLAAFIVLLISLKFLYFNDYFLWESIYMAILAGHYVLAFYYIRQKIGLYLLSRGGFAAATLIVGASILLYKYTWGLIIFFFAIHFGLSEAYSKRTQDSHELPTNSAPARRFRALHINLNTFIYLAAFWHNFKFFGDEYAFLNSNLWFYPVLATTVVLLGFFIFQFFHQHEAIFGSPATKARSIQYIAPEILYVALIPIFREHDINYVAGILYHLLFWVAAPLIRRPPLEKGFALRYVGLTTLVTGLFFMATPYFTFNFFSESPMTYDEVNEHRIFWTNQLVLYGFIHINLSFLFSSLNPRLLIDWNRRLKATKPLLS